MSDIVSSQVSRITTEALVDLLVQQVAAQLTAGLGHVPFWTTATSLETARALLDGPLSGIIASLDKASERIDYLESALRDVDKLAEAGLCCFGHDSARGYLNSIRRVVVRAGCQGGLTDVEESRS